MQADLSPYAGKRICVALSGGKDSMALLHYLLKCGGGFGITVCALNCDHSIRGEDSARDSAFVAEYCKERGVPLLFFKAEAGAFCDENGAREWRLCCYKSALAKGFADVIATAHHLNDAAETVLFNLARGTSLAGMKGICDDPDSGIIRPFISLSRGEIDGYVLQNGIPYVVDESNFSERYTRNKIRMNVLPALEEAVQCATRNICAFSRLAAEDDEYLMRKAEELIADRGVGGYLIGFCAERVIFKRAVHLIVARRFKKTDYTAEQFSRVFALQSAENGKRFEFLGLAAIREEGGVAIVRGDASVKCAEASVGTVEANGEYGGVTVIIGRCGADRAVADFKKKSVAPHKALTFDMDKIPETAVVRFRRDCDRFTKFGGGTKSLSDYLTDKKVPQSMRNALPLICDGSDVLLIGGVEISDKIKLTGETVTAAVAVCADPLHKF